MAAKITVALQDDLDGGPADETLRFGPGSQEYEIDLNQTNAAAFGQRSLPSPDMPARLAEDSVVGGRVPHQAVSGAAASGREQRARTARSATAGASRRALLSSTRPLPEDCDASWITAGANQSALK